LKPYKIVVTGSHGFIGFHLTKRLLELKYDVVGIDSVNNYYDVKLKEDRGKILLSYSNYEFLKQDISKKNFINILRQLNPNLIINLAAQAGVRHSITNPEDYVKNNVSGFLNILEYCKNAKNLDRLVYASTSSVYGGNEKSPFSEKDSVDHPLQFYAVTKRTNELMAHAYSSLFNIETVGLRFFTVYGPWGRPDMALFKFTENILNDRPIEVYNHGKHIRDFTYVDDIVDGIVLVSTNNSPPSSKMKLPDSSSAPFHLYNIGGDDPVNLEMFIEEIEKNLNKKAEKIYLPLQKGDVESTKSDVSKLREHFGYNPKTSVKEGIKKFIDWYIKYYDIDI
tara:strand:+ start:176 stop:1186 length:1011 start_codon:yes stop_codon:yes gene_type:complete